MVQVEHSKIDVSLVLVVGLKVNLRFVQYSTGAQDGTRLRMRGKGQLYPLVNGIPGDLFIELIVDEHPWFERNGMDLIMSLPLGFSDLALGTTLKTSTH